MSDFLTGGEVSGTPLETRGGTRRLGQDLLQGGRLAAGSLSGIGLDPSRIGPGVTGSAMRVLEDPADRLRGLFAALEPFERRQTEQTVEGLRGGFGRMGGRFSRNLVDTETRARGELAGNFARSREQSLLEANAQQIQGLAAVLQALLGGRGQTLDFFQPGAPNFQEGILGDLIGAGGQLAAAHITGGASLGA